MPKPFKWIEPSEKEIQNAILEYLNYQPGCFAFQVNTTGVYDQERKCYRKPGKWVRQGTPDIIVSYYGLFVGMECKSRTGRQSKEQKEFEQSLMDKSLGLYFVVRSTYDAESILKKIKKRLDERHWIE